MKKAVGVALMLVCVGWSACTQGETAMTNVYDFTMRDIDGKETSLSTFKGKVLLIVNVASKCGFTGQYAGLQKLYETCKVGPGAGPPCHDRLPSVPNALSR